MELEAAFLLGASAVVLLLCGCCADRVGNATAPVPAGAAAVTPSNFWVSPSGTFALGFLEVDVAGNSSSAPPVFSLSLFYTKPQTVVWTAAPGRLVSTNARLQLLLPGGSLVLTDGPQNERVWGAGLGAALANVSDDGRLLLLNSSGAPVWDSWSAPTDTLLPGQSLYPHQGLIGAKGLYSFLVQADGNVVMYDPGSNPYWASDTSGLNFTYVLFDSSGSMLLTNASDGATKQVNPPANDAGRPSRYTLGKDGLLVYYVLSDDSATWNVASYIPPDACAVPQLCGPYGVCTSANDPSNASHTCSCPDDLVPVDSRNWASGCHIPGRPFVMDCDLGVKMITLPGVKFNQWSPHEIYTYETSVDGCAQACNSSCSICAGATYEYTRRLCNWIKVGYLNSGNGNFAQHAAVSFVKVAASAGSESAGNTSLPGPADSGSTSIRASTALSGTPVGAVLSVGIAAGLVAAGAIAAILWCSKGRLLRIRPKDEERQEEGAQFLLGTTGPVHFTYDQLRAATNNFSAVLGRGGFGPVYRGVLAGGAPVAVKVLEGSGFGEKQFSAEVMTIGSIHHVNLVRLRGYCMSGARRLLVYDLMPNGSLEQYYLHASSSHTLLGWKERFDILLGTARAIRYLHEECHPSIVHCDIKPQNILLGEDFHARISDFGLAQLVGGEFTGSITRVRGTPGYMAPEWMSSDRISTKLDVYSYGMVVLEVLSGRKVIDTSSESNSKVELSSWVYAQLTVLHNPSSILDPRLLAIDTTIPESPEFSRSLAVAFWCIQRDPGQRPSMGVALQMLEGLCSIEFPPYPF